MAIEARLFSKADGSKDLGCVAKYCLEAEVPSHTCDMAINSSIWLTNLDQDWEIVRNHDDQQTAHLNTRYNLITHDGATIYLQTTGTRTGQRNIVERLGDDTQIRSNQYKMRLHLTMETGDPRYSWVNDGVFVASSGRTGNQVIYDAYELL